MPGSMVTATSSASHGCAVNLRRHVQDTASGEGEPRVIERRPISHSMHKWQPFTRAVSAVMVGHGSSENCTIKAFKSVTNGCVIALTGKACVLCISGPIE